MACWDGVSPLLQTLLTVLTQTSAPPLLCEPAIAEECKAACVPTPATKITKWRAQPRSVRNASLTA